MAGGDGAPAEPGVAGSPAVVRHDGHAHGLQGLLDDGLRAVGVEQPGRDEQHPRPVDRGVGRRLARVQLGRRGVEDPGLVTVQQVLGEDQLGRERLEAGRVFGCQGRLRPVLGTPGRLGLPSSRLGRWAPSPLLSPDRAASLAASGVNARGTPQGLLSWVLPALVGAAARSWCTAGATAGLLCGDQGVRRGRRHSRPYGAESCRGREWSWRHRCWENMVLLRTSS